MTTTIQKSFADGSLFEGQGSVNSAGRAVPQGKGRLHHSSGDIYEGNFFQGKPSGGTVKNKTRVWMNGNYSCVLATQRRSQDIYPSTGLIKYNDGREYRGDISIATGKPHGVGTFTWFNADRSIRSRFVGSWNEGQRDEGTQSDAQGTYRGFWLENKPNDDNGVFEFAVGGRKHVYCGSTWAGERHGPGTLRWVEDGEVSIKGDFVQNALPKFGTRSWQGGNHTFSGRLTADGFPTGLGTYVSRRHNTRYQGEMDDLSPHGEGTKTWLGLDKSYTGQWHYGTFEGMGTLRTPEFCYSGPWLCNKMDGTQDNRAGVYTWKPTGDRCEGIFAGGEFPLVGRYVPPDGTPYAGPLRNGKPAHQAMPASKAARPSRSEPRAVNPTDAKRERLLGVLKSLENLSAQPVEDLRKLECGHQFDLSVLQRLARTRDLALKRARTYEQTGRLTDAKRHTNSANQRYSCPCCRHAIKAEPQDCPPNTTVARFLKAVRADGGGGVRTLTDAQVDSICQRLEREKIGFPSVRNEDAD